MFDRNTFWKYKKIAFHLTASKPMIMALITMCKSTHMENIYKTARTNWFMYSAQIKPVCVGYKHYWFIITSKEL